MKAYDLDALILTKGVNGSCVLWKGGHSFLPTPKVKVKSAVGAGELKPFAIDGLNRKVAWHPRDWSRVSTDTGIGNPALASAEKGKRYVEDAVELYVKMLREIVENGGLY